MYKYPEEEKMEKIERVLRKALRESKISMEELKRAFILLPKGEPFKIDPRHIC